MAPEPVNPDDSPIEPIPVEPRRNTWTEMRTAEDWWAIWCGVFILAVSFAAVWVTRPEDLQQQVDSRQVIELTSPLRSWLEKPAKWTENPKNAFVVPGKEDSPSQNLLPGILVAGAAIGLLFAVAMQIRGGWGVCFLKAYPVVFLLALLSFVMASQSVVKAYNLEYALWALLVGMLISNTIGTPNWLKPAAMTEFYIKTGLVLYGIEVLMGHLLALSLPGVFVAWVVTPIVLVTTYIFGQKILKIESRSLNMVISADMSVCGVSAAIATAGACKAKKEELSLAIGISLSFTVIMMVVMPAIIKAVGMDPILGGAWIGGTIDATGAVGAAGAMLGPEAEKVAMMIKMIQNILIGVTSFGVAVYWVTYVERDPQGQRPGLIEIWHRFPKFVLGFVLVSIVFSTLYELLPAGPEIVEAVTKGSTKVLRDWLFCLAFVSIGLMTNFRELTPYLKGGKPLLLYVCGQAFNLTLTLFMAWLMFRVIFRDWINQILAQ